MRTIALALVFAWAFADNALATDSQAQRIVSRPRVKNIPCGPVPGRPGEYVCKSNFSQQCDKAVGFPFPVPPEKKQVSLPYPPTRGYAFIPKTGSCVKTEQKGHADLLLEDLTAKYMHVNAFCEGGLFNDAFVYGYCSAAATPVVSPSARRRKS